mmetsp:Transcript_22376/g.66328  ORF Transcript_22376/g.66328 Transcript_22376/m.66328 type:complete len:304 (-) Transcript_22376:158-1069(-)
MVGSDATSTLRGNPVLEQHTARYVSKSAVCRPICAIVQGMQNVDTMASSCPFEKCSAGMRYRFRIDVLTFVTAYAVYRNIARLTAARQTTSTPEGRRPRLTCTATMNTATQFMAIQNRTMTSMVMHADLDWNRAPGLPSQVRPFRAMICPRAMWGTKRVLRMRGWKGPYAKQSPRPSRHCPAGTSISTRSRSRMGHANFSPRTAPPGGTVARNLRDPICASNVYPSGRSAGATTSTMGRPSALTEGGAGERRVFPMPPAAFRRTSSPPEGARSSARDPGLFPIRRAEDDEAAVTPVPLTFGAT